MRLAVRVMRKHRIAECLLVDVIGLEWEQVHEEACRWEHVMSETVERKVLAMLGHPTQSPYGNPIPGLDELGDTKAEGRASTPPWSPWTRCGPATAGPAWSSAGSASRSRPTAT